MAETTVSQLASWRHQSQKGKINSDIVVVGLNGSGKSALINALFNKAVSAEQDCATSKPKFRKGEKHVLNYKDNTLTFWDTCGFFEKTNPENTGAFEAIKAIPCLKKGKCSALVFTIAITKTRFEKNSSDIEGMKKLEEIFGPGIWNNLIIVLTQANLHYDLITSKQGSNDNKKYMASYTEWVHQIRTLMASEVMPGYRAQTIPIVPAGYLNSTQAEAPVLNFEPKGKSWVLNIWQNLVKVVPLEEKPLLLDVCIINLFASNFFYLDSFLSQIRLTATVYKQKECLIKRNDECIAVSLALSLLHNMLLKLDNQDDTKQTISSKNNLADSAFWKSLESGTNITVTGPQSSGKTALINSLAYQEENSKEQPLASEKPIKIPYRKCTCTYTEIPLRSLDKKAIESSSIVIVCIKISENRTNMEKILRSFAKSEAKNFIIALTYANACPLDTPLESLVEIQTKIIEEIQTKIIEEILEKKGTYSGMKTISVVLAGYHNELIIKHDPNEMHWIMNLWLQIISKAKATTQPALLVILNYHILGRKSQPKKLSHCKGFYIQKLVEIISDIIKTNSLTVYDE